MYVCVKIMLSQAVKWPSGNGKEKSCFSEVMAVMNRTRTWNVCKLLNFVQEMQNTIKVSGGNSESRWRKFWKKKLCQEIWHWHVSVQEWMRLFRQRNWISWNFELIKRKCTLAFYCSRDDWHSYCYRALGVFSIDNFTVSVQRSEMHLYWNRRLPNHLLLTENCKNIITAPPP